MFKPDASLTPFRAWIVGLVVLLVAWGGRDAHADQPRVCVLKIAGANRDFKFELAKMIDQPFSILRAKSFYKAVKRLRIGKRITPSKLRQLSRYLGLDAIIDGRLRKRGRGYQLVLKVRDAATGKISERIEMRLREKSLSAGDKTRLRRQLIGAVERIEIHPYNEDQIARTADEDGDGDEVEPAPAPRRKKTARKKPVKREAIKRKPARREAIKREPAKKDDVDDDGFEDGDADIDEDGFEDGDADIDEDSFEDGVDDDGFEDGDADVEDGDRASADKVSDAGDADAADDGFEDGDADAGEGNSVRKSAPEARDPDAPPGVVVNGGLGAMYRNLSFVTSPDLVGTENPIDYQGGLVPAAYLSGEVYPMALLGNNGPLVNLGIDANFEQAVSINTTLDPDGGSADNAVDIPTNFRKVGVGVRYRLAISSLLVSVRAGFGTSSFTLDKGAMAVDIPNTTYKFVDPGVTAEYRLGKIGVDAGARFLVMLGAGEIVDAASYGKGSITAFDATGGLSYAVLPSVDVRLGFRFTQMTFKFDGRGMLSDRNGDQNQDVLGARDLYAGGLLTGSYKF